MNEKKCSEILNETISDKHIEEASGAEAFFAMRKAVLIKRKRALKMLPIIAACFVLIFSLCIGMMFFDDGKGNAGDSNGAGTTNDTGSGNNDWWGTVGDGTQKPNTPPPQVDDPWSPWDEVKYFAVPNTKATINVIDVDDSLGFTVSNNVATSAEEEAVGMITNVVLADGSAMVFEYDYSGNTVAGVVFALDASETGEGLYAYIDADGKANIAKITAEGETILATSTSKVYTSGDAKIIINWNGKDTVSVKVNGADAVSANNIALEKASGTIALAADAAGAKFSNMKATLEGTAVEFETRQGTTWKLIEEDGTHKGSLYTGYAGITAAGYRTCALVNNIDFESANKITMIGKIAVGKNWSTIGSDGRETTANQNCGFIVNVWNTNGEGDSSPLFYEGPNASFIKVFLGGTGVAVNAGKWGATTFSDPANNNDGKWKSLSSISAGEEIKVLNSGEKTEDGKLKYQANNTWQYGEYYELKVEWDTVNLILSYYFNGDLACSYQFTRDIFANKGQGIGIDTSSGDTYFREFEIIVE